nr:hypothetical protein [Alphaproteobacteria bacterium]
YKYKYNKKSQKISKYFSDDKLFYHLEISKNAVSGYHLCLQDEYKSAYHFVDNNKFTIIYDVQGPKKSYSISTEYSRLI